MELKPQDEKSDDLQFDQAEYEQAEGDEAAEQQQPAEQAAPPTKCAACGQAIADQYYVSGQSILCPRCRDAVVEYQTGGSGLGRFMRALIAGIVAAVIGAGICFGIAYTTGYEVGLVAVVVGLLVGGAVRWGARRRGGWLYQTMAILLTYCAIVATYVPYVYQGFADASTASTADTEGGDGDNQSTESLDLASMNPIQKAVLFVLIVAIAFAAPFLAGFENIIGLVTPSFVIVCPSCNATIAATTFRTCGIR